jgi:hypothetical protein
MRVFLLLTVSAVALSLTAIGCGGTPSAANISLRKELQQRDQTIDQLKIEHQGDLADLRARRYPTTMLLAPDELAKLYTVHGISFGKLTGGSNLDTDKPFDEGVKVYVVPTDDDGQPIKAAGSFTVELFDLNFSQNNLVGEWHFNLEQTRQNWYGAAFLYNYILTCPWNTGGSQGAQRQRVPAHSALTLRLTFHDELTGREFTEQRSINVNPPPPDSATTKASPTTAP